MVPKTGGALNFNPQYPTAGLGRHTSIVILLLLLLIIIITISATTPTPRAWQPARRPHKATFQHDARPSCVTIIYHFYIYASRSICLVPRLVINNTDRALSTGFKLQAHENDTREHYTTFTHSAKYGCPRHLAQDTHDQNTQEVKILRYACRCVCVCVCVCVYVTVGGGGGGGQEEGKGRQRPEAVG